MNLFLDLSDEELIECYEQMLYWGGNNNPPELSLLEKIQLKYFKNGTPNLYLIMQLDLFKAISERWYKQNKKY